MGRRRASVKPRNGRPKRASCAPRAREIAEHRPGTTSQLRPMPTAFSPLARWTRMANTPCSADGAQRQTAASSPMSWLWACKQPFRLRTPPFAVATAPASHRPFCAGRQPACGKHFLRQPLKKYASPSLPPLTCTRPPMTAWGTAFPIFARRLSCSMRRERPRGPLKRLRKP